MIKTLGFVLACWSALGVAKEAPPLRFGHVNSLTGPEASFGTRTDRGIRLAIDEINASGGVRGRKIELISVDDESKSSVAVTAISRLITRNQVVAIVGESASSRMLAMAPIAQQYGIPLVSPSATNPRVTEVGDFIFRVCFIDPYQGKIMARFALEKLRLHHIAILRDVKSDYSLGLAKYFIEAFRAGGGEVTTDQSYAGGDVDFRAQLTLIRTRQPEAVFLPGYYTDVGLILRQARELGLKQIFLGGDGWDAPSLLQIGAQAAEGSYFANHFSPDDLTPQVHAFIENYRRVYHEDPNSSSALGYDAARVLADAFARAPTGTPMDIRSALAQTRGFPGVTGRITLNAERNAEKPALVLKVENGRFRLNSRMD